VRCNHCGQNNFNWARECVHCHAPLEPTASWSAPTDDSAEPADRATVRDYEPIDQEVERRNQFVRALFAATPHTFVTWTLMAINIGVFVLMVLRGASLTAVDLDTSLRWGASYSPFVTRGEWWRLLTATFVHGGIMHIFANMYVLAVMGPVTERLYGNAAYAVLYLLAGLAGSLASVYWHPLVASVGASGAVFGVMGAVLAFTARQRRSLPPSLLRSVASSVGQAVAINLVLGFATPHVDMAAHVGGLLGGFACGLVLAGHIEEPASRKHARGAALAFVGAALVVFAARQLPVFDDWSGARAKTERVERNTLTQLQSLEKEALPDQKTRDRVAKAITEQLPPWIAMRNELARLRLPKAEHAVAAQQVQYMDLRAEAWQLWAEQIRTDDLRLLKESRDKTNAALTIQARMVGRPVPVFKDDGLNTAITWQETTQRMAQADNKATAAYNDGLKRLRANKITPVQFADIIEKQVIPPAREAADAMSSLPETEQTKAQKQRLARYAQLRVESWTLRAKALRENSPALMQEANRKQEQATAATR
jgi:membrane associated rhomboid family serine protease